MKHQPISDMLPFGALVTGLTEAALDDPGIAARLRALWIDRGVLVVRGLPSDSRTHVRLGRCFGQIEVHPLREAQEGLPPEVVDIVADPDDGDIYDLGGGDLRGGWLPWHSDLCYSDRINHGGILRAVVLPERGGRTGFIDQIAAYDTLPTRLKDAVQGLSILYEMQFDASKMRFGRRDGLRLVRMQQRTRRFADRVDTLPRAIHPIVYEQPETGRSVLHVSPWFAAGIEGREDEEGDALLAEVVAHCTDTEHAYHHQWQQDDYVVWDNWRMMHCASGIETGARRHMQRVGIAGDYGLGRMEAGASADERHAIVV
ncbi:TauD/TfdA dioxygenase family protein [Sphingomonas bacterium]|uniref:TauD/TfdA dioxygenase family protein n=1 Tax=Sphingomonas bacterium TaxID=1895847 RepID=UPI00157522A6|nr:TauD/TfdA family dioxygenase [Sphingomonas bacterium]